MLRDIVCDAASNYVLAPFLRLLTPTGFNRLLTVVFEGKWREFVDATLLQIQMSNELCGKLMKEKLVCLLFIVVKVCLLGRIRRIGTMHCITSWIH